MILLILINILLISIGCNILLANFSKKRRLKIKAIFTILILLFYFSSIERQTDNLKKQELLYLYDDEEYLQFTE